MYVAESYIRKNDLHFDDGTSKILLNTKCSPDKVPEKLRAFYAYINDPTKVDGKLIESIDERVKEYNDEEWEARFVTLEYIVEEAKEEGIEQGRTEGLEQGRTEGLAEGEASKALEMAKALKDKGVDIDIIAETSGLSAEEIEKL
jgi:flagellar biosynthesis/type III secretory pathway protein FliH